MEVSKLKQFSFDFALKMTTLLLKPMRLFNPPRVSKIEIGSLLNRIIIVTIPTCPKTEGM